MGRNHHNDKQITLRYLGLTSIVLIVAQMVFGVVQVRWRYHQQVNTLREKVTDAAKVLQTVNQDPSFQLNDATLTRLLRQMSVEAELAYSLVVDANGKTLASFFNEDEPNIVQAIEQEEAKTSDNQQSTTLETLEIKEILKTIKQTGEIREVRKPIIVAGQSKGEIRFGYSLNRTYQDTLGSAGKLLTASLAVSVLLILAAIALFEREVRQPLRRLVEQTQSLIPESDRLPFATGDPFTQLQEIALSLAQYLQSLKKLESQIVQQEATQQALAAVNQTKNEFLAMIGHEIRTPLNAVTGMTGLLLDTNLTPKQRECVNIVRSSGETLLTTINNILDFSKIEARKLDLEEQPFELGQCIEEVLRLFVPQASDKKLEMAYLVEPHTPSAIVGDSTRLRQILANLVSNAVKFTEAGEVVVYVNATPLPDSETPDGPPVAYELRFAVKDTGIGIPTDRIERLFKPFSQVDASTTRKYGGTGLGLVISRRLSELMGGKMWVHSTEGKGTTFYFTLQAKASPSLIPANSKEGERELMGKRVLIIDDNLTNQKILTMQAQSWGMFTCAVESGSKALEWLKQGIPFDLAILDMNMPQMDGLTLARAIRQQPRCQKLPLVMLSSITRQEIAQNVEDVEFAAVLTKPIQQTQLYDSLMRIFAGKPIKVTPISSESEQNQSLAEMLPLRILVAEDVGVNQEVIRLLLEKLGYWADIVSDGVEVLDALHRQSYDAILMDVRMPEMDGFTATYRIYQEFPPQRRPRIIAMTAEAMRGDREKCLAAGMDDYISKPIRIEELRQALSRTQPFSDKPAIDWQILNALRQMAGKRAAEVIGDLIASYLEDVPSRLSKMNSALQHGDAPALRQSAHALRSSSLNLGATYLAHLCQEVEAIALTSKIAEADDKITAIKIEYDRVCQALVRERRQVREPLAANPLS